MSRKIATKATAPSWCDQQDILRAASHSAKSTWHTTLWTMATRSMRSLRKTLSDLSSQVKMDKKTKVWAETVEKTLPRSLNRRLALSLLLARSGKRSSHRLKQPVLPLTRPMLQASRLTSCQTSPMCCLIASTLFKRRNKLSCHPSFKKASAIASPWILLLLLALEWHSRWHRKKIQHLLSAWMTFSR